MGGLWGDWKVFFKKKKKVPMAGTRKKKKKKRAGPTAPMKKNKSLTQPVPIIVN
jgi:hypothetical protein